MSVSEIVEQVCGWVGFCLSMFFYISPIVPIMKLIKKEMRHTDIPGVLLICTLISCVMWGEYGIQLEKMPVWLCNGVGGAITVIWIIFYFVYFAELKIVPCIIYNVLFLNVTAELFYVCYAFCGKEYNDVVGYVATVFNVLMFAAPLEKIYRIIQTGDYGLLPVHTSICGLLCSSFWGTYGVVINDIKIMIPNFLGLFFSIVQVITWTIYWSKNKNKPRGITNCDDESGPNPLLTSG